MAYEGEERDILANWKAQNGNMLQGYFHGKSFTISVMYERNRTLSFRTAFGVSFSFFPGRNAEKAGKCTVLKKIYIKKILVRRVLVSLMPAAAGCSFYFKAQKQEHASPHRCKIENCN